MRKKGLLPLILGLLLLTVFALAAFAPELFTSYSQKELFTKWLPIRPAGGLTVFCCGFRRRPSGV